ncbi:ATP-binding cassette domain-containing protein [Sphingomonas jatrophae]|uniref:Iron complex transport system ATP-binding protein n=1 Tax=Sphingomonas jatrophae TaxID=1166337 RepID=A0A1I6K910_9SPHN|nr:ATP-binding cassette domain-containing protein [Sphingomonas jatrophae]SFR87518.1 iron complex transport system ATP-binding protein [Sphingomonas jatrophae]
MAGAALTVEQIDYAVRGKALLRGVSLDLLAGKVNVILGPNGAGKSTLLKIVSGRLKPTGGRVLYDGEDVGQIDAATLARRRAFLSQHVEIDAAVSVGTVAMMGRYPHFARTPGHRDRDIVEGALALVGIAHLRDRLYPTLSGGEQQRVQLARVLAQIWADESAPVRRTLLLDEPLAGLDIQHQLQLLDVLASLTAEGCTILMTVHDLNLAIERGDRLVFLRDGMVADTLDRPATPDDALIRRVFDVGATMLTGADGQAALRFHR